MRRRKTEEVETPEEIEELPNLRQQEARTDINIKVVNMKNKKTDGFVYRKHTSLIDDTAEQIQEYLGCSWKNARGRVDQAIRYTNSEECTAYSKDSYTGKVDWVVVVAYAIGRCEDMPVSPLCEIHAEEGTPPF